MLKGVMQFRASARGVADKGEISASRIALAQYAIEQLGPFFEPRKVPDLGITHRELNTPDGAIRFLGGLRDLWQQGIQHWSQETYLHTLNVTELAEQIAQNIDKATDGPMAGIKIPEQQMQLFKLSAELHDLGKLYTPRSILESGVPVPGVRYELGKKETEIMNRHAQDVYDVLDIPGIATFKTIRDIASSHHIYADGSGGYPESVRQKLVEEGGVPFESKVLAISDIFEALTAEREYREGIGLPLSTTLNIMNGMAKRGQIDPQIFRFCVEHSIFENFAASKHHVSTYDPEMYEKLGYSNHDMRIAQQTKSAISTEMGIAPDMVNKLFKMSANRLLDKAREEAAKDVAERDPEFPTEAQVRKLFEYKKQFINQLRIQPPISERLADEAYADKLLAFTESEMGTLVKEKRDLVKRIHQMDDTDLKIDLAINQVEEVVKLDTSQKRGFYMGVTHTDAHTDLAEQTDAIKAVLCEKETEDLRKTKERILSSIPSQPLSTKERFTLFQPKRYTAPVPGGGNHRE
jgi:HD-GYP domain-containing protein (c-di-GMP phosphodiesterase class II)